MTHRIGIDAGSKTLKIVVLDEDGSVVYSTYMRHRANIARTLREAIGDLNWRFGEIEANFAITGSASIEVARILGIPFVQEVTATTHAVRTLVPEADVAIELGGEDAKIIYLTDGLEQRMNATCAGGTGGFIDTIAYMLGVRSSEMSSLAFGASRKYPIASRCAVFAQTDVRPLLNSGASKADIAASAFEAVVRQTLGGLACGRPIQGNVIFLGGPLEHMPYLVHVFSRALDLDNKQRIKPRDAHLFTVHGAALLSDSERDLGQAPVLMATKDLLDRLEGPDDFENELERLPALFDSDEELAAFRERHVQAHFVRKRIDVEEGPLYLGIDAGSTTLKIAVLNDAGELVHSAYEPIRGNLLQCLRGMLEELDVHTRAYSSGAGFKPRRWIARACATGYGEELLRAAFGVDMGVVETAAHLRAATQLCPDVTFLLDIGGQDMKALWIRHGIVVDAALNEACSSGCGAFIEGTAAALKSTPWRFSEDALRARAPIDLGTRCTVFMNSRVKHAQKGGAQIEDIAAGAAYSVVKNALHRIIGVDRMPTKEDRVVVQGGTFKSDAVLRAFEQLTGIEAIRPEQTHLMGAIGCAFFARDAVHSSDDADDITYDTVRSGLVSADCMASLAPKTKRVECTGCANGCLLSITTFDEEGERYFVSDNKCERGLRELERQRGTDVEAGGNAKPPNLIAFEQRLLASYGDVEQEGSRGSVRIGLLDAMEMHSNKPFWHSLFSELGFSVVLPDPDCATFGESEAMETVSSESVCYPAKLSHPRYFSLCDKGADAVFMVSFERGNHCPVHAGYARALMQNAASARRSTPLAPIVAPQLVNYKPHIVACDGASREAIRSALNVILRDSCDSIGTSAGEAGSHARDEISRGEFDIALARALAAQDRFSAMLEVETEAALRWLSEDPARHGIVLAGRPYHVDEALMHGIDRELENLGFAVLGAGGLSPFARSCKGNQYKGRYPWKPAKRLARLAHFTAVHPQLDAVFLESFGCGFEAVSLEEATDVLDAASKPCTILKVDDISDTAHIRIRLRTLAAAIEMRKSASAHAHPIMPAQPKYESAWRNEDGGEKSISLVHELESRPLGFADLGISRKDCVKDVCFTANVLAARVIRMLRENPGLQVIELPDVCENCLTEAIPRMVERATGLSPEYRWVPWEQGDPKQEMSASRGPRAHATNADKASPRGMTIDANRRPERIGLVGNPLMVYEPFMNDGIAEKLEELGCEPVFPNPELLVTEDVRYVEQLQDFRDRGVRDVVYLLSFACLKGHVSARGALRELKELFPDMQITVIDYDPEASALNRENRLRLAVESARIRNMDDASLS